MIPIFSNSLGDEELQAVSRVFSSHWLGKGPECGALEKELGGYFGSSQVLLMNCCTSAIYIALRSLGVGPGDEVIIPSPNFVAIPNAVIDLGAKPVFADVDDRYFSLTASEVERLKTARTKAVFLLHYGGHPLEFDDIRAACGDKIAILEDSANAVSSKYKGRHCGTLGDAGVFSFDAMKILVMGDGGALVVKDPAVYAKAQSLRYLGFAEGTTSGTDSLKKGNQRWWEFDLKNTSGRFISNDIQASIGRVQLKKLPGFIARRKAVWQRYQQSLRDIPGLTTPPEPREGTESTYYLYWVTVPGRRDELAIYLKEKGIYTTFRYFPLHMVSYYGDRSRLPNAEAMNENTLNLPLHQNLLDADVDLIVESVRAFFRA